MLWTWETCLGLKSQLQAQAASNQNVLCLSAVDPGAVVEQREATTTSIIVTHHFLVCIRESAGKIYINQFKVLKSQLGTLRAIATLKNQDSFYEVRHFA